MNAEQLRIEIFGMLGAALIWWILLALLADWLVRVAGPASVS